MISEVFLDIRETVEENFGVLVNNPIAINYGLLNYKWSVDFGIKKAFIKQFSQKRFNASKMVRIKRAMGIQKKLFDKGCQCADIYSLEGKLIFKSKGNEYFIITDFIDGSIVEYGKINSAQIRDLGKCIGKIHYELNEKNNFIEIPQWQLPTKEELLDQWKSLDVYEKGNQNSNIRKLIDSQKRIIEFLDMDYFKKCKTGWSHSDLWSHNVLFIENSVSAMLDFDRLQVNYPEFDIARALLSFVLKEDEMCYTLIESFIEGYSEHYPICIEDIERSLKLLWLIESFWWFRKDYVGGDSPPTRMLYEMQWITMNWNCLINNREGI